MASLIDRIKGALDAVIASVKPHVETIGDGSTTEFTITHNFATYDVDVSLRLAATPYSDRYADVDRPTTNTVLVKFKVAPAANSIRVKVRRT